MLEFITHSMQYVPLGLISIALFTGKLDRATGSYAPNAFWVWSAVAVLVAQELV